MSISDIIALISGIALFLFGMTLMGEGLKKVSGSSLEPILFKLSGTPLKGILLGCGVTAVIQSSSATSVMVVGFVNSKMMKVKQAIYVILGSILGTSITGWVVALSYINTPGELSSLLSSATLTGVIAAVGIILRMFVKNQRSRHLGDILMGFAVLMFGMSTMSSSVSSLGEMEWFTSAITTLSNPILGILIGLVFAAVLQSASAAVGILQALSITGAITFSSAFPLLMGINIGASVPVLLSALGAGTDGKRTAFSYPAASLIGSLTCAAVYYIADAIFNFSFTATVMSPVSLAIVNTLFRLIMLLILAPFADVLESLTALIVPDKDKDGSIKIRLEERFLAHPALAIEQCRTEINKMAQQAKEAVNEACSLIVHFSNRGFSRVEELETAGDEFEDALTSYLMKLSVKDMNEFHGRSATIFLHTLSDFERISDHALNIAESAKEIHEKKIAFSADADKELTVITGALKEMLDISVDSFIREDTSLAMKAEPLEEVIDGLCDEMKLHHVERLQTGLCTIQNGFVFNDLLNDFERISDHCSNIAVAIMELAQGAFATHEYLGELKEKHSPGFEKDYDFYREKYELKSSEAMV